MKDIWKLIQNGKFEEACKEADLEYQQTNNIFPLRNKVYALLHLQKYHEVIYLTSKLIEIRNGETDADFIHAGIAYWILGKREEAIEQWIKAEKSKYFDAAGGIEIRLYEYLAATRTDDDKLKQRAIKGIRKLIKNKKWIRNWPGPIGYYLVNEITEDQLLASVAKTPVLRERQLCQAHFALAVKELEKGNIFRYIDELEGSMKDGSMAYVEDAYYMAKGELEMMKISTNEME